MSVNAEKEGDMSGEDKATGFFGTHLDSLKAFESLKVYIDDMCPNARIAVQDSLLVFKTDAGFAYISLPSSVSDDSLFNLALTSRRKISNSRIEKTVDPVPGRNSYVYHIAIKSADDIDSEIKGWVRQSYEYSKIKYL